MKEEMQEERNQNEMIKDAIEIQADDLLIAGAILIFIGTTTAALSLTNIFLTRSPQGGEGFVIGHGVESVGNVIQTVAKDKYYSIEPIEPRFSGIVGAALQAVANAGIAFTVQEGLKVGLFSFSEANENQEEQTEESRLEEEALRRIQGLYANLSAIQSIGGYIEGNAILRVPPFVTQQIEATSDYLSSIGAAIEVIGLNLDLSGKEQEGILLSLIASWIQFIGASKGLYAVTTEGAVNKQEFDEKYSYSYLRYTN